MAVIKCVPPVPGLSTRAIGFTYESHALLFRRLFILDSIHPPSLLYRTNLSKFHIPYPCRKIWNTFRNGEKNMEILIRKFGGILALRQAFATH